MGAPVDLVDAPFDPRPRVAAGDPAGVLGGRCRACEYPLASMPPRCPRCGARTIEPERFGPGGTVFASTTLRVAVSDRGSPITFAYVDLDDGPRILAHVAADHPLSPGHRVTLAGTTIEGDPLVQLVER